MQIDLTAVGEKGSVALLFGENSGVILQSESNLDSYFAAEGVTCYPIGMTDDSGKLSLKNHNDPLDLDVSHYRDVWFSTSAALDAHQNKCAEIRFSNYKTTPLKFKFPNNFNGSLSRSSGTKVKAAIIREKGSNSEREMAFAMHSVGFEVHDIHMTDLIEGRKTLEEYQFIAAVCGFSNSVVQILNHYGIDYKDINILEDPNIRVKLSEHSNWPTIPQLFVNGELIGGADITTELHNNGQLLDILDKANK